MKKLPGKKKPSTLNLKIVADPGDEPDSSRPKEVRAKKLPGKKKPPTLILKIAADNKNKKDRK